MTQPLSRHDLARYALFGVPLGFIGLPLYVHLPKYYTDTLPVSLAVVGTIMLITRLLDCFSDPVIGYLSDYYPRLRRVLVASAKLALALGVFGLFYLPNMGFFNPTLALILLLTLTYFAYSILTINYYSAGLELSQDYVQNTRLSGWREGAIIVGVLVASALPPMLTPTYGESKAYHIFAFTFMCVLCIASFLSNNAFARKDSSSSESAQMPWKEVWNHIPLRWIFSLFFVNAIAPSITATLFLFFTTHILREEEMSGLFLVVYFISAVIAMPLWMRLNRILSKRRCLMLSMFLAIASFAWTYQLGANDNTQFILICIFSGIALGGDLAILPSLLADAVGSRERSGGLEFGIWNFISKFTLALAAGITLPLLAGEAGNIADTDALRLCYAVLPCLFKTAALILLFISPIDNQRRKS
jgi:Na+/melibiose symporter-like transporter